LALTSWFLATHIAPELDHQKILKYALAHDLVELHAGDTFTFGDKDKIESKSNREDTAIKLLVKDWPDFPELAEYASGYKNKIDEEAKFVFSVDKMLPVIMVNLGEKDDFWNRHKITVEMMKLEKVKLKESRYLEPYFARFVDWMTNPDYFYKPRNSS
jgi:putative hydrolases of HD superfamily